VNEHAVAVRPSGWRILASVRWSRRLAPAALVLTIAALFVQPPVQAVTGIPAKADPALYTRAAAHPAQTFPVIVREQQPGSSAAEDLVRSLGGHVTHELSLVGGFSATVPGSAVSALTSSPLVWRVWGDAKITSQGVNYSKYDYVAANTVWKQAIGLPQVQSSYTGAGVGVALVDTGVVPVNDLAHAVSYRVDFTPEVDGYDRFGHGTHMAGIIAGRGVDNSMYTGVAPGANLIDIKVAGFNGATDISVVIAGLQWAVSHRAQYNIKVLNLSFGTDSRQPYAIDPLDYAVEQTWKAGILVVVAAGNNGSAAGTIEKPADDPYVVTVGAADLKNTTDTSDDAVADFSSRGPTQDGFSKPDILAPGVTIVSDRDPGSAIDVAHPAAVVGSSYFKGTGTSQAAAVVSGIAALMYQANPNLTPDLAKATLVQSAVNASRANKVLDAQVGAGAGLVDANGAVWPGKAKIAAANQGLTPSTGTGSLEASRGSLHIYVNQCDATTGTCTPMLLTGEVDALGNAWSGNAWSGNAWSGNAWSGNAWSGYAWEGNAWSGNAWSGNAWSNVAWSGNAWSGNAWSGSGWSSNAWSSNAWSGNAWS
jgi:serine protease AprX